MSVPFAFGGDHDVPDGDPADRVELDDECKNCGTALPMCLYWKMHGKIACCPECKHEPNPPVGPEGQ